MAAEKPRYRVKAGSRPVSNVVRLDVPTRYDLSVELVLEAAIHASLTGCVVLGYTPDGNEYFASSIASGPEVAWLLDRCKKRLLDGADEFADPGFDGDGEVLPFARPNPNSET